MMKLFKVLFVLYFFTGAVFMLVRPVPDLTTELMANQTGRHCDVHSGAALVLFWPYYVNYYYRGNFETCLKAEAGRAPNSLPRP